MNRRAQLQRKLALKTVPKPPADLAQRIKNEIPNKLRFNAEEERERFSESIAVNLRVAASILVLIATAFLALRVVSRAPAPKSRPVDTVAAKRAVETTPSGGQPPSAVTLTADSRGRLSSTGARQKKPLTEITELNQKEEAKAAPKSDVVAAAPVPPPPPPAAPLPTPSPSAVAESITITSNAPVAAAAARAPQKTAAKITASTDPLIERFAAPTVLPNGVTFEAEAAEQPLTPGRVVVRASFDCGTAVHDMWVDVLLSTEAGVSARWLAHTRRGGASTFANSSWTTLVDFVVPNVASDTPLATLRARYRDTDGNEQSIEKVIRRSDVQPWATGSRRLKGGTLAALWLRGYADDATVANAARAAGIDDLADEIEKQR